MEVIRQDSHTIPFYRLEKRSKFEYFQQKILGRKRDRLKEKRITYGEQRRFKTIKTKNVSTCNPLLGKFGEIQPIKSKTKFITGDAAKTMKCNLKNKQESHLAIISKGKLGVNYDFPLFPWVDRILIDRKKLVIRYYNQQIFIYTASYNTNRPSKQNLLWTCSTLNGNQMKLDRCTEFNRSTPMKRPIPIIKQKKHVSETKKPEPTRMIHSRTSANHHMPTSTKIKPKQYSPQDRVRRNRI